MTFVHLDLDADDVVVLVTLHELARSVRRVCLTTNKMLEKLNRHIMDLIESMDTSTIRVDEDTGKRSVIDTTRMVLDCDSNKTLKFCKY